jgi:hypothetical protein
MNKSVATVRKLKRSGDLSVAKEIQVPYYTSTFSREGKNKQSVVVFSMFDNLATVTRKLYVLLGMDPRDQVVFFSKGKEQIYTPSFWQDGKVVSFDPREAWKKEQGEMPFD